MFEKSQFWHGMVPVSRRSATKIFNQRMFVRPLLIFLTTMPVLVPCGLVGHLSSAHEMCCLLMSGIDMFNCGQ
jgi:hypothetical protein